MFSALSKDKSLLDFNDAISQEEAEVLRDETVIGEKSNRSLDELLLSITALVTEVEEMKRKEEERKQTFEEPECLTDDTKGILLDCFIRQVNSAINMLHVLGDGTKDAAVRMADIRNNVVKDLGYQEREKDLEVLMSVAKVFYEVHAPEGKDEFDDMDQENSQYYVGKARKLLDIIRNHKLVS